MNPEKDSLAILHQDLDSTLKPGNKIERKRYRASTQILFNSWANVSQKSIEQIQDVVVYEYAKATYYIPELEILKFGLQSIWVKFSVVKVSKDEIFAGPLPFLRINNNFFGKEDFLDILIKLMLDQKDIEKVLKNLYLIDICRRTLHYSTSYLMWVEPTKPSKYRDPYWLLWEPRKRIRQYFFLRRVTDFLFSQGFNDQNTAIKKGKEALEILSIYKLGKQCFFWGYDEHQLEFQITDIVVYCYLKEIIENLPDSDLTASLKSKYANLLEFYEEFGKRITSPVIVAQSKPFKLMKPLQKPKDPVPEKPAKELQKEMINNYYFGGIMLLTLGFIYHHYH